jgi:hypothetical protein
VEEWFKMSDVNVKVVSPSDPRFRDEETSSYLLNVQVLEELKQAIKQAKDANTDGTKEGTKDVALSG